MENNHLKSDYIIKLIIAEFSILLHKMNRYYHEINSNITVMFQMCLCLWRKNTFQTEIRFTG